MKKFLIWFLIVIIILTIGIFLFWFYVPFADSSVKAGQLNYVMHKGVIFKTYEGKLIQTGLKSSGTGMQSNEFKFSIEDKDLALKLMSLTGKEVKLHYKEYYGKLPWRGYSAFIVDSIVAVEDSKPIDGLNL